MSWNFNRLLKTEMGLWNRLTFYRKPIKSLKTDLMPLEKESIEAIIYGFGWVADNNMARIPETDCIAVMVVTPIRIVMAAGELTTAVEYHELANCFWIEGDFCFEVKEKVEELGAGFRFEPRSDKWTEHGCVVFEKLVRQHIEECS